MNPISSVGDVFAQGGPALFILLACSVLMIGVVIERMLQMRALVVDPAWLLEEMAKRLPAGQAADALQLVKQAPGCLARVFEAALLRYDRSKTAIEEAMSTTLVEQSHRLERHLSVLGTLAVIAPFIGLFGTVLGIIRSFHDMAEKANANPAAVGAGISEALIATAAGLFVAIISVVAFNAFKQRVRHAVSEMQVAANRLSEMIECSREGVPLPADLVETR
ncbi:MAG: MotA/TolQ/ExbB proton channel family protein [Candidatus Xenobia bacterium]